MSKKVHIFYAMFISFLAVMLNCFISLYLTPRITNSIGVEAYGFVALAKQFTSYASIAMIALNSYAARYMSISYMQNNIEEYKKYYNTVFWGDAVIGFFLLVIGVFIIGKLELLLDIPSTIVSDVKILFFLTFVTFFVTTISTVFLATGHVKDRLEIVNSIKGGSYLVEIIILYISFFVFAPRVWYVGIGILVAALTVLGGNYVLTKKLIPESSLRISLFNIESFKKLVLEGFWNSANSLGNALNTGLDLLVSNIMLSALAMGQVSIAKTINSMIFMIYSTVFQPFQPTFLKKYADNDIAGLVEELKYSMRVCGILTNVIFCGFCIMGLRFFSLWIPTQDIQFIYVLTVITMLPCISEGCVYPLFYIYTLTVKNKIPCIITIIGGLVNVIGMYLLIRVFKLGALAVVITTAVVMNIINFITNPIYMAKCLHIKTTTFYPSIIKNIVYCTACFLSMKIIATFFPDSRSWGTFIVQCLLCGLVGLFIQILIAYKPKEIKRIGSVIIKRVKK